MPLKSNRKVTLSEADKRAGRYVAVEALVLPAGTTREVWLEAVPFPVRLIKQVFTNDDGSTDLRYLVTSDLALDYDRITKLFQKRWGIEVCHKSLKQNTALENLRRARKRRSATIFLRVCAPVSNQSV